MPTNAKPRSKDQKGTTLSKCQEVRNGGKNMLLTLHFGLFFALKDGMAGSLSLYTLLQQEHTHLFFSLMST